MEEFKYEFKELQLSVPWGHITAKAWGCSTNPPILMVHGTLDNAGSFDRLIPLLPDNYYIVCIDLPGHGLSSHFPPGLPLHFFDYIYTIQLILEALHWKTCIYIGHSLGGQLGIIFSALYPERIEKLITLDAMLIPLNTLTDLHTHLRTVFNNVFEIDNNVSRYYTLEEVIHALKYKRNEGSLNQKAAEALFQRAVTKVDNLYKYNRDIRVKNLFRPTLSVQKCKEILYSVSVPVLMIFASDSYFQYILVNEKIPNNITVMYVKGNHDVHNNNPQVVASDICKFLNNTLKSKL